MDKRNKLWRREQQNRVFKARMVYHAACGCGIKKADGNWNRHPHWFELARVKWMQIYKKTGTPCSCWLCRGETSFAVAIEWAHRPSSPRQPP